MNQSSENILADCQQEGIETQNDNQGIHIADGIRLLSTQFGDYLVIPPSMRYDIKNINNMALRLSGRGSEIETTD